MGKPKTIDGHDYAYWKAELDKELERTMDARVTVKMSDDYIRKIRGRLFTLNTGMTVGTQVNFKGHPGVVEFIESQTGAFARVGGQVYFFTFKDVATGFVRLA